MMSKKWILRTLALLVIVSISTVAIVRHQHQQLKVASAQAKKDKKEKAKSEPDKDSDEPAPAAPAKMEPLATALGPAAREHLAEQAFIAALREVFIWRSSQPQNPETNRVLLEKLSTIACEGLSQDRKSAWQSLLQAWKTDPAKATDPQLKVQGERAAEILNAMFKAHGDGDIVL